MVFLSPSSLSSSFIFPNLLPQLTWSLGVLPPSLQRNYYCISRVVGRCRLDSSKYVYKELLYFPSSIPTNIGLFIYISVYFLMHIFYRMVFGGVNGWFIYNQVTPKRGILIANILICSLGREKGLTDYYPFSIGYHVDGKNSMYPHPTIKEKE